MTRQIGLVVTLLLMIVGRSSWATEAGNLDLNYEQRFVEIEAQLAALNQNLHTAAPDAGCSCGPSCGCTSSGLYAGAEVVFAKTFLKESFRASVVNALDGSQTLLPFDYGYNASPRVWLGYTGPSDLGARVRYWRLEQNQGPEDFVAAFPNFPGTQTVTVIFPAEIQTIAPGEILRVSSNISLQTLDLEGTFRFDGWGNRFLASGGLQYGQIAQSYQSQVIAGGVPVEVLNWDRQLHGIGPTVGLQAWRPVGYRGFELFGGVQLALLFGEKSINRFTNGGAGGLGLPIVQLRDADELLVTGQIQLGGQWTRELSSGALFFLRGTYEGQVWTDSGGSALGYLGVEGFGISTGITR